jgi:CRP-like cAMP-binding protein
MISTLSDVSTVPTVRPTVEELSRLAIFGGLGPSVLADWALSLPIATLSDGDLVFEEGDLAHELYVVLAGQLHLVKRSRRGALLRVGEFLPGQVVGELSFLDLQPRSATVRAHGASTVLRVSGESMNALYRADIKAYALVVLNLARELTRRLRIADAVIVQLAAQVLESPSQSDPPLGPTGPLPPVTE